MFSLMRNTKSLPKRKIMTAWFGLLRNVFGIMCLAKCSGREIDEFLTLTAPNAELAEKCDDHEREDRMNT
ncbi:unnamed protein product [Caenorhabditis sp. 36 PRJEB53466]|nr:unnamed protein product [Caenorhabditis sp. 36 PRJEB53466]